MHIFVYGSLLSGLWNNNLLSAGIPKLCRTKHKYTLYIENKVIPSSGGLIFPEISDLLKD